LFQRLTEERRTTLAAPPARPRLSVQGRHKEAEAACRAALRLQPDAPLAHSNPAPPCGTRAGTRRRSGLPRGPPPPARPPRGAQQPRRCLDAQAAQGGGGGLPRGIRLQPVPPGARQPGAACTPSAVTRRRGSLPRPSVFKTRLPRRALHLGNALLSQGRYKEAEAAYRAAIRLRPDFPWRTTTSRRPVGPGRTRSGGSLPRGHPPSANAAAAHTNSATPFSPRRYKEAEAAHRRHPHPARLPHSALQPRLAWGPEPVQGGGGSWREAIRIQPDYPEAHDNSATPGRQGRYKERGSVPRSYPNQARLRQGALQLGIA